jgi:hypothetical protein
MIEASILLADAKAVVRELVDDLRSLTSTDPDTAAVVDREYSRAMTAGRTALAKSDWAETLYAQVAVAWVLAGVFVRFCEDNDLVPDPLLAGLGPRRSIALDHRSAYLQANPAHDDRHWLREIASRYRSLPATGEVFGDHNPIWELAPSADGARGVVQFLQAVDPDTGDIRHDYTDPSWDTRFLGDLYQDLSEHATKVYALLQTPEFVEEFILDRTLDPAIATFGLRETTLIDPTCGSGHFLLGAFDRIFDRWREAEPTTNPRELARRACNVIAGVDLNPFAAAIARFRLLVAALRAGGDTRLANAPAYPIHVAVGDSLLHGDPPGRILLDSDDVIGAAAHGYATEDVEETRALLAREWHAVVGNPPYITMKDPALSGVYRSRFKTCYRQYSLGVPFTERFFQLARHETDLERCGFVGMITTNSFMKREFGKKLIEEWVPSHDLTHVIDTSGAYIPGHGTPTVILLGRNRRPVQSTVRAVMAIRGEPSRPADPAKGLVWSSVVDLVDMAGSSSEFVSVVDLDRTRLSTHPWSIGGGGAAELKERLDATGAWLLRTMIDPPIGRAVRIGSDEVFEVDEVQRRHSRAPASDFRHYLVGEAVRDWSAVPDRDVWYPHQPWSRRFEVERWPWRTLLAQRRTFQGVMADAGLEWWHYMQHTPSAYATDLSIAFSNVATHNHFALTRGGIIFNAHAPVIKLPAGAEDRRHLELLGVLNSSAACFWMQQVFHNKGGPGGGSSKDEKWHDFYEHDGTKLQALPLPRNLDGQTADLLDRLAGELASVSPGVLTATDPPTADTLAEARRRYEDLRAQMIAAQERLDWEVYRRFELVDADPTFDDEPEPPLLLGQRAFEIVLARKVKAGESDTKWFSKLGITPITELPAHWPDRYREVVERRMALIANDPDVALIERPETKRRWESTPWEEQVRAALRLWLLDRLEDSRYWSEPASLTSVARLAALARADADFVHVAVLYSGRDLDIATLVSDLVKAEAVPYLAALRYTESGLRKHAQWLETWELQRREDAGQEVERIEVPPRYTKADFQGTAWDHRGKLDVPKERFISYPGASRETDPSLVVGWEGWDHLAQARALATWYLQAKRDGRDVDHLTPLLAGLAELMPWLKQWYDEANSDPALDRPGSQIAALVDAELRALQLTPDDLASWLPPPVARGRTKK